MQWRAAAAVAAAVEATTPMRAVGTDGSGSGSSQATVMVVDCASVTPIATVTTPTLRLHLQPGWLGRHELVGHPGGRCHQFMPSVTHPVGPGPAVGDDRRGLVALDNKTTCLKFTAAGNFHYRCTDHGFKGTVNVTQ